jgi:hypothetical protein
VIFTIHRRFANAESSHNRLWDTGVPVYGELAIAVEHDAGSQKSWLKMAAWMVYGKLKLG